MVVCVRGQVLDAMTEDYQLKDKDGNTKSGQTHKVVLYADGDLIKISVPNDSDVLYWCGRKGETVWIQCRLFTTGNAKFIFMSEME